MGTLVEVIFRYMSKCLKKCLQIQRLNLKGILHPKPLCYVSLFTFPEESEIFPQTEGSQFGFIL